MSETSPFPIGGKEAMQSQINYPREAIMNNIEG